MSSLGLGDKLPDAAHWCEVSGAESVRDIYDADCAEQLAKDLGLPLVKANKLIKAIKELGSDATKMPPAGGHLDISAAEQAFKLESEILSILRDHKSKKENDLDNPVELACDLSTQYFRARDDLFMCRLNVENAIFKSKGEESTEELEQTKLRDAAYQKYLAVSKKLLDACNSGSGLIGRFHEENKATKARADRLIQLLE